MAKRKEHQNLVDARNFFGINLSKDVHARYYTHTINWQMFEDGCKYGMNPDNLLENIDENIKKHCDYESYVSGFDHARRILKNQADLYTMGMDYFNKGFIIEDINPMYVNNKYFMCGYNDAKTSNMENINTNSRR